MTPLDNNTCAAIAFRAADLIEFTGHGRSEREVYGGATHCVVTAIGKAVDEIAPHEGIVWFSETRVAAEMKRRHPDVVGWSDTTDTDEVIEELRQVGKAFANGEVES